MSILTGQFLPHHPRHYVGLQIKIIPFRNLESVGGAKKQAKIQAYGHFSIPEVAHMAGNRDHARS